MQWIRKWEKFYHSLETGKHYGWLIHLDKIQFDSHGKSTTVDKRQQEVWGIELIFLIYKDLVYIVGEFLTLYQGDKNTLTGHNRKNEKTSRYY